MSIHTSIRIGDIVTLDEGTSADHRVVGICGAKHVRVRPVIGDAHAESSRVHVREVTRTSR